ncbi:MAG: TIGR04282 family arsenosugar biosynthesis glycosyltransferase [Gammaproteobacteria bacterium]
MAEPALFIFAKAPIAGAAKTRLQPAYTAAQAAEVAALLIRETMALAAAHWEGPVYLATTPDTSHPLFAELAAHHAATLRTQRGADLGARMHEAIAHGVAHHGAAAVIGCDVPHCPAPVLRDAAARLVRGRDVLGPSTDGGYYIIGLHQPRIELFTGMAWGSADVCATTVARARALGLELDMLPLLRDIDTAEDLRAVASAFPPLRRFTL